MAEQKLGIRLDELEDDTVVAVSVGEVSLAVVKHGGKVYALDGKCTHEGGSLGEGYMDNNELICPLHSGAYSIESGKANENTPWVSDVRAYMIRADSASRELYVDV
jgi:nitrite reductase/ring-hydroxylating ferredoxin subunit